MNFLDESGCCEKPLMESHSLTVPSIIRIHSFDSRSPLPSLQRRVAYPNQLPLGGSLGTVTVEPSIFLDFNLPNAATWFYFSLLLTIALFFQFTRLLSIRNLDLV